MYQHGFLKNSYSQPYVIEDITFDRESQIYIYTYILTNLANRDIWWWGIWYKSQLPLILDATVVEEGFAQTDKDDCFPGWKNTAPAGRMGFYLYAGPQGEMGFFSTYASDFESRNPPNIGYMEGGIFHPLYSIEEIEDALSEGKIQESDLSEPWLGAQWGWSGPNANILTAYGIQYEDIGYYVIRSTEFLPGNKSFFYNTVHYWNSYYDNERETLVIGGFESVAIAERTYYKLGVTVNSPARHVEMKLEGYDIKGYPVQQVLGADVIDGQAIVDLYVLDYGTYTLIGSARGYRKTFIRDIVVDETNNDQDFIMDLDAWIPQVVINRKNHYLPNYFEVDLMNLNPDDIQSDWPTGLTVELGFYNEYDDSDQNGIPDTLCSACWNDPNGEIFYLHTGADLKKELNFSLPAVVDESIGVDYHMTDFAQDGEWGIAFSLRLLDSDYNPIVSPSFYQFRVKKTHPIHPLIAETQTSFYSDRIPHRDITVSGPWRISDLEEGYTVECKINLSTMDPYYLRRMDEGPLEFNNTDAPLTFKLDITPREEDPNSLVTSIFFIDSYGNAVEYNPPDPSTGHRDLSAPPITYDIPLHKDLQHLYERLKGQGYSSEEALIEIKNKVAYHPDEDFIEIEDEWEVILGKYAIYYKTGVMDEKLFRPGPGENIEVIISYNEILMARIRARHTSLWFTERSVITIKLSDDDKDMGCFINSIKDNLLINY
ncbi:MAG: hypothetical protein ACMUJM_07190 [bacterium]